MLYASSFGEAESAANRASVSKERPINPRSGRVTWTNVASRVSGKKPRPNGSDFRKVEIAGEAMRTTDGVNDMRPIPSRRHSSELIRSLLNVFPYCSRHCFRFFRITAKRLR